VTCVWDNGSCSEEEAVEERLSELLGICCVGDLGQGEVNVKSQRQSRERMPSTGK